MLLLPEPPRSLRKGLVFNKYTGSRGKGGSNDANAEYIGKLRNIMDTNEVSFQTAELGKVDQGGGGTIAADTSEESTLEFASALLSASSE